jgi:hypothetical protein
LKKKLQEPSLIHLFHCTCKKCLHM